MKRTYHYYQRDNSASRCGFKDNKIYGLRTYERIIEDAYDDRIVNEAKLRLYILANHLCYEMYEAGVSKNISWSILRSKMGKYFPDMLKEDSISINSKVKYALCLFFPKLIYKLKRSGMQQKFEL